MLKLKASARPNRRYLLIQGGKEDVEKTILDYIGILGWAKADPFFVESKAGKVVLAVEREELENVKAALSVGKETLVLKVSGTIKGLKS